MSEWSTRREGDRVVTAQRYGAILESDGDVVHVRVPMSRRNTARAEIPANVLAGHLQAMGWDCYPPKGPS